MKPKYAYFLLAIILFFNVVLISKIKRKDKYVKHLYNEMLDYKYEADLSIDKGEKLSLISDLQFRSEDEKLNNILLYDTEEKEVFLADLLSNQDKLVYYFSSKGCYTCYEPVIHKLDSLSEHVGEKRIILIAHFPSRRDLKAMWSNNGIKIKPYLAQEELNFPKTEPQFAYLFLLNNSCKAQKVIITDNTNIPYYNKYIHYMYDYLGAFSK